MNKLSLLSLLLCGSSAFAMNDQMLAAMQPERSSQELIQEQALLAIQVEAVRYQRAMARNDENNLNALTPEEKTRQEAEAKVLGEAFSRLPNNQPAGAKQQEQFAIKIRDDLAKDLKAMIAQYKAQNMRAFVEKNMSKLIPSVIPRDNRYPSMHTMIDIIVEELFDVYKSEQYRHTIQPYILAVAGFWSYEDEGTDFRHITYRINNNHAFIISNLQQFFQHKYPGVRRMPLEHNEFMAVLFSDGSIKWRVSDAIKELLNNNVSAEQLHMCVNLFDQPNYLKDNQWDESYITLPIAMFEAVKSNYSMNAQKSHYLTRRLLKNVGRGVAIGGFLGFLGYCSSSGQSLASRVVLPLAATWSIYITAWMIPKYEQYVSGRDSLGDFRSVYDKQDSLLKLSYYASGVYATGSLLGLAKAFSDYRSRTKNYQEWTHKL